MGRLLIYDKIETFNEEHLRKGMALMPQPRREKIQPYKSLLQKKLSVIAYLLLRKAMGGEVPPMSEGEHDKPYFPDASDVHFNLSHCRCAVACAIDDSPVGVDVECIRAYKEPLARYTMNDQETSLIESGDKDREFTRLWTMKEALVKQSGRGITSNIKNLLPPEQGIHLHVYSEMNWILTLCSPHNNRLALERIDSLMEEL